MSLGVGGGKIAPVENHWSRQREMPDAVALGCGRHLKTDKQLKVGSKGMEGDSFGKVGESQRWID